MFTVAGYRRLSSVGQLAPVAVSSGMAAYLMLNLTNEMMLVFLCMEVVSFKNRGWWLYLLITDLFNNHTSYILSCVSDNFVRGGAVA